MEEEEERGYQKLKETRIQSMIRDTPPGGRRKYPTI
jgi:hypothetical protein